MKKNQTHTLFVCLLLSSTYSNACCFGTSAITVNENAHRPAPTALAAPAVQALSVPTLPPVTPDQPVDSVLSVDAVIADFQQGENSVFKMEMIAKAILGIPAERLTPKYVDLLKALSLGSDYRDYRVIEKLAAYPDLEIFKAGVDRLALGMNSIQKKHLVQQICRIHPDAFLTYVDIIDELCSVLVDDDYFIYRSSLIHRLLGSIDDDTYPGYSNAIRMTPLDRLTRDYIDRFKRIAHDPRNGFRDIVAIQIFTIKPDDLPKLDRTMAELESNVPQFRERSIIGDVIDSVKRSYEYHPDDMPKALQPGHFANFYEIYHQLREEIATLPPFKQFEFVKSLAFSCPDLNIFETNIQFFKDTLRRLGDGVDGDARYDLMFELYCRLSWWKGHKVNATFFDCFARVSVGLDGNARAKLVKFLLSSEREDGELEAIQGDFIPQVQAIVKAGELSVIGICQSMQIEKKLKEAVKALRESASSGIEEKVD